VTGMGVIVGIDEAGLGPNLGPFVVTAIAWEVPGDPHTFDLKAALSGVMTDQVREDDSRLVIADSKLLFQPHRSLHVPERSVLALLALAGREPRTLRQLDVALQPQGPLGDDPPWVVTTELPLPMDADAAAIETALACLRSGTLRVRRIESRIVHPHEFNRRLQSGNKAAVTSGLHAEVLAAVCRECCEEDVLVYSDKHGGRNAYGALLSATFDGAWIRPLVEGPLLSAYRLGRIECRFEPRAEQHLPVAMASMISKYCREAHMRAFNRFWIDRCPGLRPTQGYPEDARRFLAEIEASLRSLGIDRDILWRRK
jgi:hypothetical protein